MLSDEIVRCLSAELRFFGTAEVARGVALHSSDTTTAVLTPAFVFANSEESELPPMIGRLDSRSTPRSCGEHGLQISVFLTNHNRLADLDVAQLKLGDLISISQLSHRFNSHGDHASGRV